MEQETVKGTVEKILFRNLENNFHIFRFNCDGEEDPISVKGIFININPGAYLEITGIRSFNKYGEQFEAQSYLEKQPITIENIVKYLSGGFIKGIGPVYAKKIVDKFGDSSLDIIEMNPSRLLEIPGIGKKKLDALKESYEKQKDVKEIMIFLNSFNISSGYAMKIYKRYGRESIDIVSKNPYRLADDIVGIGFLIADQIALKMGFDQDSLTRAKAVLTYVLKEKSRNGHVFLHRNELIKIAFRMIGIQVDQLEYALVALVKENRLIMEDAEVDARIYLPFLCQAENGIVDEFNRLNKPGSRVANPEKIINQIIEENKCLYNKEQLTGIKAAMTEKLMVLTGGPGTGKTTTILGIIEALKKLNLKIVLAAPTGRAAKRLSEVTGEDASTIHRLLEYNVEGGFFRNENNKLEGSAFIVDESSMIDVVLLYSLLKSIPDNASLILIGDVDQLPAVGPGNVLKDIIASGFVKTIFLTEIFRQAKKSRIVINAHRINNRQMPLFDNNDEDDYFLIRESKEEKILELIKNLCLERLPKKYGIHPVKDIQVLVPMKKGIIGSNNINKVMQGVLNPHGRSISYGDNLYKINDKVMQIKNNYEKKVFNGDIGWIVDIGEDDDLLVDFDGNLVTYGQGELDEIQLAYCITIHKSQGSEYDVVIIPLVSQHYIMLDKNLLYTGITRAKKLLIMIATEEILNRAVKREHVDNRNTAMKEKLKLSC